jgi:N-acetylneuraminic acid mutarotase
MRIYRIGVAISITLSCLVAANSVWAVPALINFQGSLAGSDGVPVEGTLSINFSIYKVVTEGEPIWKESQELIVSNGMFSVQLGSIDPFPQDLFDNDDLFLEIQVLSVDSGDWETLAPRMRLTSTAFAMKAAEAERVSSGAITSVMLSPGAVTTQVLSNNAVTAAKIGSGAVGSDQISDGSVAAVDVAFNFAVGSTRGGAALDLDCTNCVSSAEVQAPLSLSGSSAAAIIKGSNTGSGYGVQGEHGNGNYGYLGGSGAGVYGRAANGTTGWLGSPSYGVYGANAGGYAGAFSGDVAISGAGKGLVFPDGSKQISAVTGGGVPSGFLILGKTAQPPAGYSAGGAYLKGFTGVPDQWAEKAEVPTPAAYPAVAEVKDKIYLMGGMPVYPQPDASTYEYEPLSDAWAQKADMPTARYASGVAVVQGLIYVIGGYGGATVNESFDPANNQWSTHARMPTPRTHLACAEFNGKIYCFGGEAGGGDSAVTEMYDPTTDKWQALASMPEPRSGHSAIATDSHIFVIGGSDRNDRYDPQTNTWDPRAPLLSPRQYLATVTLNGKIHALGGGRWIRTNCQERCNAVYGCDEDIWVISDTMEIYDAAADQWIAKRMSGPRAGFGAAATEKKAYLLGGMLYDPDHPYFQYQPQDAASEYATNSVVFYLFEKE